MIGNPAVSRKFGTLVVRRLAETAGLALVVTLLSTIPGRAVEPAACRAVTHEGARYTVCEADLKRHTVRLFWAKSDGQPYMHLAKLPAVDPTSRRKLAFALNGGMFHDDLSPVGLYVAEGREARKASTRSGPGNFHLKPNGIFYLAGGQAGVLETGAYLKQKPASELATQSGPMLVIAGKLHPKFRHAEASKKYRDGVGVRGRSSVVFAISEDEVSFAQFARLYRDVLKCPNALFLDGGSAPALYAPGTPHKGNFLPLGPMLAVYGP
jgi:uncharacterized protein YigE (DUF2233 family)